jgi:hypothetical protein
MEVTLALARHASYLGGALDLEEAVRALVLWGDRVRFEWARVYAREGLGENGEKSISD